MPFGIKVKRCFKCTSHAFTYPSWHICSRKYFAQVSIKAFEVNIQGPFVIKVILISAKNVVGNVS